MLRWYWFRLRWLYKHRYWKDSRQKWKKMERDYELYRRYTMQNNIHEKMGKGVKFERIRRITGYLVGSLSTWNNAKKAEERDRVKHSTGGLK